MVGRGFIVRVKLTPALLTHPFAFFNVIVPLYVLACSPAGTSMLIGLGGNAALVTAANPAAVAAASQVILYVVGKFVALYGSVVVCADVLKHTLAALAAGVMVD